ncbi:esterase-like activity of phytase family protein, partial [Mycobacterium tuberculosis]|nr:esterase-like activity of phytase family protein [Mycobacterium tuberculosis]
DATSAAFLPSGDLLLLERRFELLTGPAMRIRRLKAADIAPGATVDGEDLITANITTAIDNMEGLAVDTAPDGGTILTIVSD